MIKRIYIKVNHNKNYVVTVSNFLSSALNFKNIKEDLKYEIYTLIHKVHCLGKIRLLLYEPTNTVCTNMIDCIIQILYIL